MNHDFNLDLDSVGLSLDEIKTRILDELGSEIFIVHMLSIRFLSSQLARAMGTESHKVMLSVLSHASQQVNQMSSEQKAAFIQQFRNTFPLEVDSREQS